MISSHITGNVYNNSNESYFESALSFILETQNDYNAMNRVFYKKLSEAKDTVAIQESFSEFTDGIIEIINRFIKFIKEIFNKFINYLISFINKNKFIRDNKDKIYKFTSDDEFDILGYNYSFNSNIPTNIIRYEFMDDFRNDSRNIEEKYNELQGKLSGNYYDVFRAEVLGIMNSYIDAVDYNNELTKIYRSNSDTKEDITVDSTFLRDSLTRFLNYKDTEKEIKRQKDSIEDEYKRLKDEVNDKLKLNYSSYTVQNRDNSLNTNRDNTMYINLFIKAKTNQIDEMCKIHTLAFSSKLDALKEAFIQDSYVCSKALRKIKEDKF